MSETTIAAWAGLLAGRVPVPLQGVEVLAQVCACAARVTLRQRYRNVEPHAVEIVYVFPLDEGAAVCAFEAEIDGARVVARVAEREAAFARYDDALAAGHGASLLDQERPDVFSASLGNVPSGAEVTLTLVTVAELPCEGDALRFTLPTTVAPRYAPVPDRRGVGRSPADALNPPVRRQVPYGLRLSVDVDLGATPRAIESPTHAIAVELDGERARVSLSERLTALDRDFVLLLRPAAALPARAWTEPRDGGQGGTVLCAFEPRFEFATAPSEIVFVVDRSGSMEGTSIAEARNALQLCLGSLAGEHSFNVVGFGSRVERLFPSSRRYDESSLAEARAHVAALQADLGGTEILDALEAVFAVPAHPGVPRQLFVLTDGQVTNTSAVLQLVRRQSDRARVFAFGIGAGASAHLVRGLARAGEGAAEFIAPGERIEAKVLRQLERALTPAVTSLALDWGGLVVEQAPHRVPQVFSGGRLLVYGSFEGTSSGGRVTLRGLGPSGPLEWSAELAPLPARDHPLLATLAARALIRDLEEGASRWHDRDGSLQARGGSERVKAEIVGLATAHGLVSRETSFVAVDERATPLHVEAQLRRVTIALTRGWGGLDDAPLHVVRGPSPAPSPDARPSPTPRPHRPPAAAAVALAFDDGPAPDLDHGAPMTVQDAPSLDAQRPLDRLVALQRADGAWELDDELAALLGIALGELEGAVSDVEDEARLVRCAWATALALRWLERRAGHARDEWRLLARKAEAWLRHCGVAPSSGGTWRDWAARRVR